MTVKHVAIIMDGNGRWAEQKGLPRIAGHQQGSETIERIVKACINFNVSVLTLYAFSSENWKRPKEEVEALMNLFALHLDDKKDYLKKENIKLKVIGNSEDLPEKVKIKIKEVESKTAENTLLTLNLALNYGGRQEILNAVKNISRDVKEGKLDFKNIDQTIFSEYLYTKGLPDPDLIIRTAGEFRLSNFLLWQLSYSEFYSSFKMWPDFNEEDFKQALKEYNARKRKFGGLEKKNVS